MQTGEVFALKFPAPRGARIVIFSRDIDSSNKDNGSRIAEEKEPVFNGQNPSKVQVEEEVVTKPHHRSQLVSRIAL